MRSLSVIGRLIRDGWLIVGLSLLLFCLLEGGAQLALQAARWIGHHGSSAVDPRAEADTYADSSLAHAYFREYTRSFVVRWEPYVYWRRKPYQGTYINVDTSGLRVTPAPAPAATPATRPLRIFMFGGSTMWSTGARDAFAIPALVASDLRRDGLSVDVTNFAETGYVSTQSLIALMLALRAGRRPDIVVFYDGVNDTFSAYSQELAGLPNNEWNRVAEFNMSRGHLRHRSQAIAREVVYRLATVTLIRDLLEALGVADSASTPTRPDSLARQVVATYLGNLELLRALSEHYHFETLAYWQPTLLQKPRVTQYESLELAKLPPGVTEFFRQTYAQMASTPGGVVHDLSQVFADSPAPTYIDWMHIGEGGDAVIARRIARDIRGTRTALEIRLTPPR